MIRGPAISTGDVNLQHCMNMQGPYHKNLESNTNIWGYNEPTLYSGETTWSNSRFLSREQWEVIEDLNKSAIKVLEWVGKILLNPLLALFRYSAVVGYDDHVTHAWDVKHTLIGGIFKLINVNLL